MSRSIPASGTTPAPSFFARPAAWWRTFGRPPRIMGLDVARAVAILGMVAAHLGVGVDEVSLLEPATWTGLVHGRSSILFAVLAGISITLMTGRFARPEPERMPGIRLSMLGRGAAIFVVGLALEWLNTSIAVILTLYGVLYVLAIPFLRWRSRSLLLLSAAIGLLGAPLLALLLAVVLQPMGPGLSLVLVGTYPITVWLALLLAGMVVGRLRIDRGRTAGALLLLGALLATIGYGASALYSAHAGSDEESVSAFGYSDSGLAGKGYESFSSEDYGLDGEVGVPPDALDFDGLVCDDYGDGFVSCYPEEQLVDSSESGWSWEGESWSGLGAGWSEYPAMLGAEQIPAMLLEAAASASPHSGGSAEIVGSGGFALAVIGLSLLLSRPLRWPLLPIAALGSMPLTTYSLHVVVFFVLGGPLGYYQDPAGWGWFALLLVIAATAWSAFFGRGPLERLVARAARAAAEVPRARRSEREPEAPPVRQ
ncbi:heparan-alpha-glucosaminide N-acetyltransferase domain-containing protein [Gulosibacter sp. 10]|uniref:heparan-alpha-glucosaminide N-acetyltransferase domain-containing protein n=1 Tax=Gulosibacter sp. 10 TaxID=1255570 RepID=UPI0020CF7239|nr:heparan-alpha-glucosaminide N-acetyltransferase domain-containing protein [Gulosibacter sp. 10]